MNDRMRSAFLLEGLQCPDLSLVESDLGRVLKAQGKQSNDASAVCIILDSHDVLLIDEEQQIISACDDRQDSRLVDSPVDGTTRSGGQGRVCAVLYEGE